MKKNIFVILLLVIILTTTTLIGATYGDDNQKTRSPMKTVLDTTAELHIKDWKTKVFESDFYISAKQIHITINNQEPGISLYDQNVSLKEFIGTLQYDNNKLYLKGKSAKISSEYFYSECENLNTLTIEILDGDIQTSNYQTDTLFLSAQGKVTIANKKIEFQPIYDTLLFKVYQGSLQLSTDGDLLLKGSSQNIDLQDSFLSIKGDI